MSERVHTPQSHVDSSEWLIRHAGRESGPFDVDRLRTLARRGALTRFHQLSRNGQEWMPATDVRVVFNEDGTVVPGSVGSGQTQLDSKGARVPDELNVPVPQLSIRAAAWSSAASHVTVRSAQIVALSLATLALAAPTGRAADGTLQWWLSGNALAIAVHALCAVVVLAWWVTIFLPPAAAMGSALAAVSCVLAVASVLPTYSWAAWVIPAGIALPMAALLVACDSQRASQSRAAGIVAASIAALGVVGAGVLLYFSFSIWGAISVGLYTLGSAALMTAGVRGATNRTVFTPALLAGIGLGGALFAAAIGGLQSELPIQGARGAVAAVLVISLSVLTWSGAHQALFGTSTDRHKPLGVS